MRIIDNYKPYFQIYAKASFSQDRKAEQDSLRQLVLFLEKRT